MSHYMSHESIHGYTLLFFLILSHVHVFSERGYLFSGTFPVVGPLAPIAVALSVALPFTPPVPTPISVTASISVPPGPAQIT